LILAAVPLGFLLLLLVMSLGLQNRTAASATTLQRSAQVLADSDRALMLLGQADRRVAAFKRTKSRSAFASYESVIRQMQSTLADVESLEQSDPANYPLSARLRSSFERGIAVLDQYMAAIRAGDVAQQRRLETSPSVRKLGAEITSGITAFENAPRNAALKSRDDARAQIHSYTIALFSVSAVGVAVTLLLFIRFGFSITRRVRLLAQNARRLAKGEKTDVIAGHDEISQLDAVYHAMTKQIQGEKARSTALQRALLPQQLPAFPGIRLDASYVSAAGELEIGGDWYDVFRISDRRVGISIGDVAGHGLRAAAIMSTARQALRTIAYFNDSPAGVLARANEVLCRTEAGALVTAFFATLDLMDGSLEYSFAGHPPPLIVRTGGTVEHLPGAGFVLGVQPRIEYVTQVARMDIGSALVLYTDGVVESGRDYFEGLRTLEAAVEAEYRDASRNIAEAIQDRVLAERRPRDDSAVLFVGVTALGESALRPERVVWTIDARSERSARRVKRALLWHLGELAGNGADLSMSELILSEMLGNVARHTPGPAEVILEWSGDTATIRVFDEGPRFEPPAMFSAADVLAESGRGLFLLRTMSRHLSIEWTGGGNCVSAVLPLTINDRAALPSTVAT
jgi:serine phosphatase RsbU (regulator of sigma subunit)/anti-sigma regulatory factor (Ser/Thr protein kinase)/CHASE3 domain sensor protein